MARVQKIIQADPERLTVSKNAAFAIALATEMFIQHLAISTHNVVKAERKPRRNIQYRDVSSAIAKTDNLEFLVDVVPKTTTFKEFRKRVEEKGKEKEGGEKGKGMVGEKVGEEEGVNGKAGEGMPEKGGEVVVLGEEVTPQNGDVEAMPVVQQKPEETPDAMEVDGAPEERVEDSEPEQDAAAMQIEMEMRGPPRPQPTASPEVRRTSGFTAINGSK